MHTSQAMNQSLSNEWYTPYDPWIKNTQILFGGQIDLDPFSNDFAQTWINARVFWTIKTKLSPLRRHWGTTAKPTKVWFNPPYGGEMPACTNHLIDQYELGHVSEACALVRGDSNALKRLQNVSDCWCEPNTRIKFILPNGYQGSKPIPGYRLFYLGHNAKLFFELFSPHGAICTELTLDNFAQNPVN
jgi:hypothetical protein